MYEGGSVVKNLPANSGDGGECGFHSGVLSLEEEMATHSSILAWEIPQIEEPSGLQSMWSQRIRHD